MRHFLIANNPVLTVKDIEKFFITKGDRVYIFASSDERIKNSFNLLKDTKADIILCLLHINGLIQKTEQTEISEQLWELAKEIKIFNFFDKDLDFDTLFEKSLQDIKNRDYSNKFGKYKSIDLEKYKNKMELITYSGKYDEKMFKTIDNREKLQSPSAGFQLITYLNSFNIDSIFIIGYTFQGAPHHNWNHERKTLLYNYKFKKNQIKIISYYSK